MDCARNQDIHGKFLSVDIRKILLLQGIGPSVCIHAESREVGELTPIIPSPLLTDQNNCACDATALNDVKSPSSDSWKPGGMQQYAVEINFPRLSSEGATHGASILHLA